MCVHSVGYCICGEAGILDVVYVMYNDHAAVGVSAKWKVEKQNGRKKSKRVDKKKKHRSKLIYCVFVEHRVHTDLMGLSVSMVNVSEELNVSLDGG